jgi:O-6-methylguanine DNA methyltransferase
MRARKRESERVRKGEKESESEGPTEAILLQAFEQNLMDHHIRLVQIGIPTALGEFVAGYSTHGLARLDFPSKSKPPTISLVTDAPVSVRRWHEATTRALKNVLAGKNAGELPPLDWSDGTDFQRAVWSAMRTIRVGQTLSYGEIARAIGKPKALRAVGGACGANPIPVLVPCHRVLAAKGKIGGFSGGLDWKRTLLEREGVKFNR